MINNIEIVIIYRQNSEVGILMRIFDTITQELKYKVLKEVARLAFEDRLSDSYYAIPRLLIQDGDDAMRCCIYKDRAIVEEMVRVVVGVHKNPDAIVDVLDIACDECPINKYTVSEGCRGCISHKCVEACPVHAISIGKDRKAHIDQTKCIECGKCYRSCPYTAIREQIRPCVKACKINAIKVNKDRKAIVDHEKCVSCGACMVRCPFGAIQDKSYILDAVDVIKNSRDGENYKVYAIIAPSIVSQYKYADVGQIVTAIKKLGCGEVVEVALGADITAYKDAHEFVEKGMLLSSCCPSFVEYVEKAFPKLAENISHNVSPMVETAKLIKERDPNGKVIFIGPCISKKKEFKLPKAGGYIDVVITFEELQALLDSRSIHAENLEASVLNNASYYGRIFARAGGVTEAVKHVIQADNIDMEINACPADGLDQIKLQMLKNAKGLPKGTFIEGMACSGGCINGGGCVCHGAKSADDVNKYGKDAMEKTVKDSISPYLHLDE